MDSDTASILVFKNHWDMQHISNVKVSFISNCPKKDMTKFRKKTSWENSDIYKYITSYLVICVIWTIFYSISIHVIEFCWSTEWNTLNHLNMAWKLYSAIMVLPWIARSKYVKLDKPLRSTKCLYKHTFCLSSVKCRFCSLGPISKYAHCKLYKCERSFT